MGTRMAIAEKRTTESTRKIWKGEETKRCKTSKREQIELLEEWKWEHDREMLRKTKS